MNSTSQSTTTPVTATVVSDRQTHPLLAAYLTQLAVHPLRTKCLTLGVLQLLQEVLASHLARIPAKRVPKEAPFYQHALARAKIDTKALKMAFYGFFVSAPLGHLLVGALQKVFAGKNDIKSKIGQILTSNFLVAPVQVSVYLASMAIIGGAKSREEVMRTVRGGFMNVMRLTWMTSPLALVFAQKYLSPDLWVPFFNFVQFVLGTYFNTKLKKMRMANEAKNKE